MHTPTSTLPRTSPRTSPRTATTTTIALAAAVVAAVLAAAPGRAGACGMGAFTTVQGTVAADAQRIFVSVHGGQTDIVVQVAVPKTTADYGGLIPLFAQPTIDPKPVATSELDALDGYTQPRIQVVHPSTGGGGGCGCGADAGGLGGPDSRGGVVTTPPVNIGPLTAVAISGDDAGAVTTWLSDNGFVVPDAYKPLVAEFSGAGRWLVALRRNDHGATGDASSIGVHFTLTGDHRGLPLRFTRIGAAAKVAFTVFMVADQPSGPATPFRMLTLDDLTQADLLVDYGTAVANAIKRSGNHAFVIEGTFTGDSLTSAFTGSASLLALTRSGQTLTRQSAVFDSAALDTDTVLNSLAPSDPPRFRTIYAGAAGTTGTAGPRTPAGRGPLGAALVAMVVLLALVATARRARRTPRPAAALGVSG